MLKQLFALIYIIDNFMCNKYVLACYCCLVFNNFNLIRLLFCKFFFKLLISKKGLYYASLQTVLIFF